MAMRSPHRIFALVAVVAAIPLLVYGVTYMWSYAPEGPNTLLGQSVVAIALIGIFLAFPYWMFKIGAKAAKVADPKEPEVKLSNIAKDKDELNRTPSA